MRIRELTLRNFRGHVSPEPFQFSDRFTVIAGINGQGKTALLDALALLFGKFLPLISPANRTRQTIKDSEVNVDAESTELLMSVNCAGVPLDYKLSYQKGDKTKVEVPNISAEVIREVQAAYGDPDVADEAPLAVYYTTDRAGYQPTRTLPVEVPKGQAAAYAGALTYKRVNFRDFMERFRTAAIVDQMERQDNPNYIGDRATSAISRALPKLLDDFDNLRVEEKPIRLVVDKGGVPLRLSRLSDGERSLLALVCDLGRRLALANPKLDNPLDGKGVVLIDELELHLHPKWQREICEKLRNTFPNIQFIGTTHSAFVIQSLQPDELINLDSDESSEYSGNSIEDIAESVMGVELPQRSEKYLQMMNAAEKYFRLLRETGTDVADVDAAEERLNELAAPFSDDPAFQALLKLERETRLGEEDNETS